MTNKFRLCQPKREGTLHVAAVLAVMFHSADVQVDVLSDLAKRKRGKAATTTDASRSIGLISDIAKLIAVANTSFFQEPAEEFTGTLVYRQRFV